MDVDFAGIWVVETGGKHVKQVVSCRRPCQFVQDGAWSPDGKTIAYVRADPDASGSRTARSRILRLDLASGATRTLATFTGGKDAAFSPRWSPDGRRLVFELTRFVDSKTSTTTVTGSRIGTVRADGTGGLRYLTPFKALAGAPDWNSRRNIIVYQAGTRGIPDFPHDPANLFTINPDGTGKRQLTHFPPSRPSAERAVQPTWTPDGNQVIFTYVRGTGFGHPVAAFIRSDGSNLKAPSPGSRIQTHPRQQP
jgi:Tol biopolymer transport system component